VRRVVRWTVVELPTEEMLILENYASVVDPSRRFVSDTVIPEDRRAGRLENER
jgi:hypothetical protein